MTSRAPRDLRSGKGFLEESHLLYGISRAAFYEMKLLYANAQISDRSPFLISGDLEGPMKHVFRRLLIYTALNFN